MPHTRRSRRERRHPSISSQPSSLSSSTESSVRRKQSHRASRRSGHHRNRKHNRGRRIRRDVKDGLEALEGADIAMKVGKTVYKTVEKVEGPAKKLGKVVLWSAPLVLAFLEIRHELHHQSHKRRMMDKEYEKAHLEIQLQTGKSEKGISIEGTKSHESDNKEAVSSSSKETTSLPSPAPIEQRYERALPSRHFVERESWEIYRPILPPPVLPEIPPGEVWASRRRSIKVKQPGTKVVRFPRRRLSTESLYEYERW